MKLNEEGKEILNIFYKWITEKPRDLEEVENHEDFKVFIMEDHLGLPYWFKWKGIRFIITGNINSIHIGEMNDITINIIYSLESDLLSKQQTAVITDIYDYYKKECSFI